MVILQEGWVRKAADLARPVCERVANIRRSEAVPGTGILGVGLAVNLLDFLDPFRDLLVGEGYVLILPSFEIKTFHWLFVAVTVQEDRVVLEVVQSESQVAGMYRGVSSA